ncbi:hypothetical protein NC653_022904 [Populus alba x Populus x berolinensis]|uniref:Uncharacterized protein n=1 Tax=Populus alba x Populus x berolinensis TaxID=444605 RepID=A0AAD6MGG4_9ROSI|nr:hypothetical protein NC653_022899 [Populus alba x Populus x berolinensis]KAJ6984739.1 hypothetical protein NC653_022904 [Populus alba x Populus x berolinensis]
MISPLFIAKHQITEMIIKKSFSEHPWLV